MTSGEDVTKGASHEKRSEPREAAHDPAKLLLGRDRVDAWIVDRSLKGMRLRLLHDAPVGYSSTLTVLDLNRAIIHQARVVWKAYPDIGMQVQSSFNVRTGEGPDAPAMRRLWLKATSARA
jgi:hypothetical protein